MITLFLKAAKWIIPLKSGLIVIFLFLAQTIDAQQVTRSNDSIRQIDIEEIVITANRFKTEIVRSGASVEVLDSEIIRKLPVFQTSAVFNYLQGLHTASTDGMGLNPVITLRGFHGGGEAEYISLLIDGIPLNDLENGLANWNLLPQDGLSSVEMLRGGSSALYGDAAMGGVINIITEKSMKAFTRAGINFGSNNSYSIGLAHGNRLKKGMFDIYTKMGHTDGYRHHSKWDSKNLGGKFKYPLSDKITLTVSTFNQFLQADDPGTLSDAEIQADRKQSNYVFRNDGKDHSKLIFHAEVNVIHSELTTLNASLNHTYRNSETFRTYTQVPLILELHTFQPVGIYDTTLFGNTKKRILETNRTGFALRLLNRRPELNTRLTSGVEFDLGQYHNKVYDFYSGFEADYKNNFQEADSLDSRGKGNRINTAAYFSGETQIFPDIHLLTGLRYDYISDAFSSNFPSSDTSLNKSYHSFSPKLSLNCNTGSSDHYTGSIFFSYGHAFKAPTIDQRTDLQKLSYAMFIKADPAYQMIIIKGNPLSNAELEPQISRNYELGTHQHFRVFNKLNISISSSYYYIEVENEIDFDLSELRYRNIQSSIHKGIETGLKLKYTGSWLGFVNFNYSESKFASGDHKGKLLKGVPKTYWTTGLIYSGSSGFGVSVTYNGASGMFLDDENTQKLESYGVVGSRFRYEWKRLFVFFDIDNLLNHKYSSTGYLFYGKKFLYPASERMLRIGLFINF